MSLLMSNCYFVNIFMVIQLSKITTASIIISQIRGQESKDQQNTCMCNSPNLKKPFIYHTYRNKSQVHTYLYNELMKQLKS